MNDPVIEDDEVEGPTPLEMAYRVAIRAKMDVVKVVERVMDTEWLNSKMLGLPSAQAPKSAEEYFGFHARDVGYIHHFQQGVGRGLFLRLYDGRMFDAEAKEQNPDRALYDTTLN